MLQDAAGGCVQLCGYADVNKALAGRAGLNSSRAAGGVWAGSNVTSGL